MVVLDKISNFLNQALLWIAGLFLLAMITITGANIVLRQFGFPIRGTFELMGYFGAIVAALALQRWVSVDENTMVAVCNTALAMSAGVLVAVMVGLVKGGETLAGWIHDQVAGSTAAAELSGGSDRNAGHPSCVFIRPAPYRPAGAVPQGSGARREVAALCRQRVPATDHRRPSVFACSRCRCSPVPGSSRPFRCAS